MSKTTSIWPLKLLVIMLCLVELILLGLFYMVFYLKPVFLEFLEWEFEQHLWVLMISPLLSISFIILWKWKFKALQRWKESTISIRNLEKDTSFIDLSFSNSVARFILYKLATVFLMLALLGPKSGGEMTETLSEGVEVVLALDLSKSMLAEDVNPNRLYAAKTAIKNTVKSLKGDQVAMVVFAANAYTQLPLTTDYASILNYLETLNTATVPVQGTSLSNAITESLENFNFESTASKHIILFTDGEDHEEEIEQTLESARDKQVKISCVAIGSENGAPIPLYGAGDSYKKNDAGKTIITKINSALLSGIAAEGDGFFTLIKSSSPDQSRAIKDYLSNQQKTETGSFQFVNLTPRFPIPLGIAIILFILAIIIKEKKGSWF